MILHRPYTCLLCGLRWALYTTRVVVGGEACPFCGGTKVRLHQP